jgi:hypothetical protein
MSILPPYVALESSAPPVSPLSEPLRRVPGPRPRSVGPATLPLQSAGRQAPLHQLTAFEQAEMLRTPFGMGQGQANQWMHVLLPALLAALRTLGDAPARSLTALAQRLGVSEVDAAAVVGSVEAEPAPIVAAPVATPDSPLCP